jgi:hypothetical protein
MTGSSPLPTGRHEPRKFVIPPLPPLEKGGWRDLKDVFFVTQYIINSYPCIELNGGIVRQNGDILST